MSDWRGSRERFPTLLERAYFASQSLGAYPREALDDLDAWRRSVRLRNRGIPEWAGRWAELHGLAEQLLDAPPGSVFFRDSATAVQAAVAASLEPTGARRRLVVATGDFHSSRYLWSAQALRGFEVVEVESNSEAHADAEPFLRAIDERVAVVAVSLVSPRSGALLDAAPIVEAAHRAGAVVVLDTFQAVGIVPVRVPELRADVLVGGFHKWVGGCGTGLAFGYVAPALCERLRPVYPGWMGHADLLGFRERYEPAAGAARLQQGMPAMEPVYTSRAGIRWVLEAGIDDIRARSVELCDRVARRALAAGLRVRTPLEAARRGGMICVDVPDAPAVVAALAEEGIDVDVRPGAGIRVGPHPCATPEECDLVVDRIAATCR